MYKKFYTIVKIVNIVIPFYIKTSNENSKKSDFFYFPSSTTRITTISIKYSKKILTLVNKYIYSHL